MALGVRFRHLLPFAAHSWANVGIKSTTSRLLKNDVAHGLTVSPPKRDKLTMSPQLRNRRCTRAMNTVSWLRGSAGRVHGEDNSLKSLSLILSLSKDEAKTSYFSASC